MQPDGRDITSLWDILTAARNIQEFIRGMSRDDFSADKKTYFAVISQIEIVEEATKRLSVQFREAHADIPWKKIAGMRDILIHAYDEVDTGEVWKAAMESVPELMHYIEPLLPPADE